MNPSERPTDLYALKAHALTLHAPETHTSETHAPETHAPELGDLPPQGGIFRVKPGFNPNSSSLGTSVVTLVWGVGVAGAIFQLVGLWLQADLGDSRGPEGTTPGPDTSMKDGAPEHTTASTLPT